MNKKSPTTQDDDFSWIAIKAYRIAWPPDMSNTSAFSYFEGPFTFMAFMS